MSKVEDMDQEALQTVAALATKARVLQAHLEQLEQQQKEVEATLRRITDESLPEAMAELGLTELRLEDGSSIKVDELVSAGIPKPREQEAFTYLREHELGDVIKNEVTASFGRGQDAAASSLVSNLAKLGYQFKQKESVHPGTLKALAREKLAAGDPLPADLFGVFVVNRAVIKRGS